MKYQVPMFGSEDSLVKTSVSREWGHEQDSQETNPDSSMHLLNSLSRVAPKLSSSKTLRHSSLPTKEEILESSYGRWPNSGMALRGELLTVDTSASPSHVLESSLSDILEAPSVPERYYLSPNAATGILRRADRMGRNLFPPLRSALEILASDT